MISKNTIKYVRSLHQKKFRQKFNVFITEGHKIALELLNFKPEIVEHIYATEAWIQTNQKHLFTFGEQCELITEKDMERITALKNPSPVLIVAKQFEKKAAVQTGFSLYLDNIKNPGNMGTIIRIADWFGMDQVICAPECVEIFSPKVIQSSMGSVFRIALKTQSFDNVVNAYKGKVYGTVLEGTNVFKTKIEKPALIVVGNESKGIDKLIQQQLDFKISIPAASDSQAESLNAAIATGIICAAINNAPNNTT